MTEREQDLLEKLEDVREERDALLDRIAELEAEVEHWRDIASSLNEVVERQGAEVERLRKEHLGMSDEDLRALREKGAV